MRALIVASIIALALSAGVYHAAIKLRGGASMEGNVIERRDGMALVHTTAKGREGLAWVDETLLDASADGPAIDLPRELESCKALIARDQLDEAYTRLLKLVDVHPGSFEARMVLALAMRRSFRFASAAEMVGTVIADKRRAGQQATPDEYREQAECAVLAGSKREAQRAITDYRRVRHTERAARQEAEAHCTAMRRQLDGGERIVFAHEPPPWLDREKLKQQRANWNKDEGDTAFAAALAGKMKAFLKESSARTATKSAGFITTIYVNTDGDERARTDYFNGGSEDWFRQRVSAVGVNITVDTLQWQAHWDWQKQIELLGVLSLARQAFPNAFAGVRLWGIPQGGGDKIVLAVATQDYANPVPTLTLNTDRKQDPTRGREIREEQDDYEKHRNR